MDLSVENVEKNHCTLKRTVWKTKKLFVLIVKKMNK